MRIARILASCSAVAALTFLICAMAGTAAAQWLSIPLPGTPRKPDGKPDLSGIWHADSLRWNENLSLGGTLPESAMQA